MRQINWQNVWLRLKSTVKLITWKRILVFVVIYEGVFGFFSMAKVRRPFILDWIPDWGTPSLPMAGSWILANWLPVLMLYFAIMGFLSIAPKGAPWEKDAKDLRIVATWVVIAAFSLLPVLGWIFPDSNRSVSRSQDVISLAYNPVETWTREDIPPGNETGFIDIPVGYTLYIDGPDHMLITYALTVGGTVSYHKNERLPVEAARGAVAVRFSNKPFTLNGEVKSNSRPISVRYAFCPMGRRCGG